MEKDSRDSHFTGGPTLSTTDRISFCTSHETFFPSNLQFYYLEAYLLKVILGTWILIVLCFVCTTAHPSIHLVWKHITCPKESVRNVTEHRTRHTKLDDRLLHWLFTPRTGIKHYSLRLQYQPLTCIIAVAKITEWKENDCHLIS